MFAEHHDVIDRIERLERRVSALEAGAAPAPAATGPVAAAGPASDARPAIPAAPAPEDAAGGPGRKAVPAWITGGSPAAVPARPKMTPPAGSPGAAPARPKMDPRPGGSVEELIGGKWFLVLGALIVVAGVGFFLKLAYDQGWITGIPPAWRCVVSGLFGAALLGAGQVTRSRLGAFASVGFTAAGLGVLYATAYAAYGYFGLAGPGAAFAMLAGVAALGLVIALKQGSVTLGVLAVLGGYLTPLILADADSPAWALPAYLMTLLLVASALALRATRFQALASLAWWGTVLIGAGWTLSRMDEAPALALVFVGAAWAVMQGVGTRVNAGSAWKAAGRAWPAFASLSTTLWALGLGLVVMDDWGVMRLWTVPAALAAATLAGGMALAGMLRVLTDTPRTMPETVGASLTAQGGAMLPVALLMGLQTQGATIGVFVALGMAAAFAGRWVRALSLAWYGAAMLGIASLVLLASFEGTLHAGNANAVGLVFTWWTLLAVLTGLGAMVSAALARAGADKPSASADALAALLVIGGSVLLAGSVLHADATATGVLLAYLVFGTCALGAARATGPQWAGTVGLFFASLSVMAWIVGFVQAGWFTARFDRPALLHPGLLWSVPVASLWIGWGAVLARSAVDAARRARVPVWIVGAALLLVSTTLETARVAEMITKDPTAQSGSVSLWWAALGAAALAIGFARRVAWLRYTGIGLLLATAGKVLTWDLAQVSPVVRVASFIVTGLVLLVVAAWYLRAGKRERV
ncbi:MAG: DUF2339 domain-containing protein [Phycisphaerales bacterium]|nr:DUF2339 domain-containing protein [Planctomycetota bacterium]MCH8509168.1 DUF2339 domain-containing protein [Phycisphaerales bacterium]